MKSAGELVRDLVWGNIAPLVLYTDLQRCFLKRLSPRLKAVLCILARTWRKQKMQNNFFFFLGGGEILLVNRAVCARLPACVRVCVCVCARSPIHKRHPEMPPSSLFTFCILSGALIQKPEPCE